MRTGMRCAVMSPQLLSALLLLLQCRRHYCSRALMVTRLRPARLLPRPPTTSPWLQQLQQVLRQWQSASATHLPCGLMADLNGGVGIRADPHQLAAAAAAQCGVCMYLIALLACWLKACFAAEGSSACRKSGDYKVDSAMLQMLCLGLTLTLMCPAMPLLLPMLPAACAWCSAASTHVAHVHKQGSYPLSPAQQSGFDFSTPSPDDRAKAAGPAGGPQAVAHLSRVMHSKPMAMCLQLQGSWRRSRKYGCMLVSQETA